MILSPRIPGWVFVVVLAVTFGSSLVAYHADGQTLDLVIINGRVIEAAAKVWQRDLYAGAA